MTLFTWLRSDEKQFKGREGDCWYWGFQQRLEEHE